MFSPIFSTGSTALLLLRHLFHCPDLWEAWEKNWIHPWSPLRHLQPETLLGESFDSLSEALPTLKHHPRPVVIRGLANALSPQPNLDWLETRWGDFSVPVNTPERSHVKQPLRQVISALRHGEAAIYVENTSDIIGENPDFEKALGINHWSKGLEAEYLSAQLFLGGPRSGSNLHCAKVHSLFFMLAGEKQWILIDPKYSLWLYPRISPKAGYLYSKMSHHLPVSTLAAKFPLYLQVPKVAITLKAGDALYLPSYWWHAVDNAGPYNLGISTRWCHPRWYDATAYRFWPADLAIACSRFQKRAWQEGQQRRKQGKRSIFTDKTLKDEIAHGFSHFESKGDSFNDSPC